MFFHNNELSISKVKSLIADYKKVPRRPLEEFNKFIAEVQKEILESDIFKRERLSLMMGRLLYACNFDKAVLLIQSAPKQGMRWWRAGGVATILCVIVLFFIIF